MAKIFLSYSRADAKKVNELISKLEAAGHQVWIDRAGIHGGEIWRREIVNAVSTSDVMILVLSSHSIESDNVRKELDLAEMGKLRILPVAIEPVTIPPEFLYQLVGIQRIDLYKAYDEGLHDLLDALGREQPPLGKPAAPPVEVKNKPPRLVWMLVGIALLAVVGITYLLWKTSKGSGPGVASQTSPALVADLATSTIQATAVVETTAVPPASPTLEDTPAPTTASTEAQPSTQTNLPSNTMAPVNFVPGEISFNPIDGSERVYIPAGDFPMGITAEQADFLFSLCEERFGCVSDIYDASQPVHTVTLDAYWIDKYEVSNARYARCVSENSCRPPSKNSAGRNTPSYYGNPEYENYPVVYVNWSAADAFCRWAGGHLPTEAEWEKAGRGSDGRLFPWGNEPPDPSKANVAMLNERLMPVDSYPLGASPYGVLNLSGNVWEWVSDWYDRTYYVRESSLVNPAGPDSSPLGYRAGRGGSYELSLSVASSALRDWYDPNNDGYGVGFRCAYDFTP